MTRKIVAVLFLVSVAASAHAAPSRSFPTHKCPLDPELRCVMSGLDSPRGLAFGPEGALYVAEAGRGAGAAGAAWATNPSCINYQGGICYGSTGAISRLWDGNQERFVTGLPSIAMTNGNRGRGPSDISFQGRGGMYVTIGLEADPRVRTEYPMLSGLGTIIHVAASGEWQFVDDIGAFEEAANPDGGEIDDDPYGILALPGQRIIADAGGNALLRAGANGEVSLLATFPSRSSQPPRPSFVPPPSNQTTDAVPTVVVQGPDGAYYIGELTGVPFVDGRANIYRFDPEASEAPHDFKLSEAFLTGFKMIIDMAFDDDGSLYVLQHATGATQQSGLGVVIRVVPDLTQPDIQSQYANGTRSTVVSGLFRPTSIAIDPDHALYISVRGLTMGGGEVIRVEPSL